MSNSTSSFNGGQGPDVGPDPGSGPGFPRPDSSTLETPIIAAWSIMMVLAAITVGLRFYTRHLIIRVLGVEDWLILAAMILAIGACIGFVRQTFSGLGHHIWTLSPENIKQWQMEQWYSFVFYTMSLACTKVSILVLYLRILTTGPIRIANIVVLTIVMICNIWVFVGMFVGCIPLAKTWDPSIPGTCLPQISVTLGNSILHVITDFIIFALPLPVLVKLNMNIKQKVALILVFSLGFFVCLVSLIRIVSIVRLDFLDITYTFSTISYWGAAEVNLAIICACLTTLKPLLVRLFPRLLGSTIAKRYGTGASGMRPTRGTVTGQRSTVVEEEEGGFTRLDNESDKSANVLCPAATYEMKPHSQTVSYAVHVTSTSKAHEKLGLR